MNDYKMELNTNELYQNVCEMEQNTDERHQNGYKLGQNTDGIHQNTLGDKPCCVTFAEEK